MLTDFNAGVPGGGTGVALILRYLPIKGWMTSIMMTAYTFPSQSVGSRSRFASMSGRRGFRFEKNTIDYTDRVYGSLTVAGRKVAELTLEGLDGISSLVVLLRTLAPEVRGLARLTVRNMSRGWRLERPLMLYSDHTLRTIA